MRKPSWRFQVIFSTIMEALLSEGITEADEAGQTLRKLGRRVADSRREARGDK
jgi:hypothetical protein